MDFMGQIALCANFMEYSLTASVCYLLCIFFVNIQYLADSYNGHYYYMQKTAVPLATAMSNANGLIYPVYYGHYVFFSFKSLFFDSHTPGSTYLATITSADEYNFIRTAFPNVEFWTSGVDYRGTGYYC